MADEPERRVAEEFGVILEASGLTRMAARMVGWLLVCDPPHQSSSQLAVALGASKASISTSTRLLLHSRLIERVPAPNSRQDHFRLRPDLWGKRTIEGVELIHQYRLIAERGLAALADAPAERRRRLAELHDFALFYERELPELMRRWTKHREEKGHDGSDRH